MEKELLEAFEAAKKAADAVTDGGGKAEVDRCLDALRRLRKIPVTTKVLVDTQVGKRLRSLAKHSQEKIRTVASDLVQFWKNLVIEETAKNKKANNPQEKNSVKIEENTEQVENTKAEKMSRSGSIKGNVVAITQTIEVEKVKTLQGLKTEKVFKSESLKVEKITANNGGKIAGNGAPNGEMIHNDEKQDSFNKKLSSAPNGPPRLASIVKCNNPQRDKFWEILVEAFSRVSQESKESNREEVRNIWDEVDACDPIRVAVTVESALFEKLGPSGGSHKAKYRSIMFNLKDSNNQDFRRRVLLGEVKPEEIVDMSPEEMASDDRKRANKQIKEKALFECERGVAPKATTDQFKCGRCGQRKCTYYQMQTRSADEPMTTYVTCVNCNNHWKFC